MHLNPELKLHKLGRHFMIVDTCVDNANLTNVYRLNSTAGWLWENLSGREFAEVDIVNLIIGTYDVEMKTAQEDVAQLLENWKRYNFILGD